MKRYEPYFEDEVEESLKRTKVVRDGKKITKWTTDREGYKIDNSGSSPKEVKMSPEEMKKRKKGAKKGAKKAKAKSGVANAKRQRSMKKK